MSSVRKPGKKAGARLPSEKSGPSPRARAGKRVPRVLIVAISRDLNGNQQVLPLAGGFLKSYADKQLGGRVEIRTLSLFGFNAGRALEFIDLWDPDIVAFSCYLWSSRRIEDICRRVKEKYPRKRIILGGPEATGRKADLLEKCGADALVLGEGEATFTELLARYLAGRDWKGTPGVLVRSGGAVHEGPPSPEIRDLDSIPSPFSDAPVVMGIRGGGKKCYTFETMRGCPNKCTFCVWTQLAAKKPRYFSDKRIAADLARIAANSPGSCVFVADSDMFLNHPRALRLAPVFRKIAEKNGCYFIFQTNLNHWTPELMRAWNHKCFDMNAGVNSVNPAVQKILGRSYPKSLVEKKLAEMRRCAPETKITMQIMFAAPGETFAAFCEAFDWAWRRPVSYLLFFHTQPLHGTLMRARAGELGIKYRQVPPYHIISTREAAAEEIKTEGLMVLFSTVWMYAPRPRAMYLALADGLYGGSLAAAFLAVWGGMKGAARRTALEAWERFNGGSDWFPDDFQLDLSHGYAPPGTRPFLKAANGALLAAYGRYLRRKKAGPAAYVISRP